MTTYIIQYSDKDRQSHWILTQSYAKCIRIQSIVDHYLKQYLGKDYELDSVDWFKTEKPEIIAKHCEEYKIILHKDDRVAFYNPHALMS